MPKYPKNFTDVSFYTHRLSKSGRRKKIAGSTKAVSDFLVVVHEDNPTLNISELRNLITNKSLFLPCPDAVTVLNAYIKAGEGDIIPYWR